MIRKEILVEAREMIADPKHWVQGGSGLKYTPEYGICGWCLVTALHTVISQRVYRDEAEHPYLKYLTQLSNIPVDGVLCSTALTRYNDTHTHEQVLAVLDKAIASLS